MLFLLLQEVANGLWLHTHKVLDGHLLHLTRIAPFFGVWVLLDHVDMVQDLVALPTADLFVIADPIYRG